MRKGNYRTVFAEDENSLYVFSRTYQQETTIILLNNGEQEQKINIREMLGSPLQDVLTGAVSETIVMGSYEGSVGKLIV